MKKILVLCTGNSARSQLAQGYLQHFAGDKADVYSAGVEPKGVNPLAVQVMAEDGVDISHHTSNHVDEYAGISFDYVITVCDNAREQCPVFPSDAQRFHQPFPDPTNLTSFRQIRDQIKVYSRQFVDTHFGPEFRPFQIGNARPEDKETVIALLHKSQLLTADLPPNLTGFVIAKDRETCVGVAGLEHFGNVALLRSVAVDPDYQGQRIAAHLVSQLLETAKVDGLTELYLITTTADRYFERYGFKPVDRLEVPAVIQQTQQFSDLCPASAVVMKRTLNQDEG
jgi:thioredoxin type arsenate reductase